MSRKLFGTDGIRGKANIYPMVGEVAMALGRAVTTYFQKTKKGHTPVIIIGKDTRLSCYMIEQAFASGVCSQGGRAILTGPLPTPGVAFVTSSMRADAGVMISASHNPYYDNGIKIFDADGNKLPDEVELELERMILDPDLVERKTESSLGRAQRLDEVVGRYIVKVKSAFPSSLSLEGTRLVVDCAHGAAYKVAPMVFRELGAEVIALGVSPNGANINHESGALHPENCAEAVVQYRADLGICLDGDADRIVIINGNGDVLNGDHLIGICGRYLHETKQLGKANEVVGTVMSNLGLENYFKKHNVNFYRTAVGDRYIVERMNRSSAVFGGEPSGHVIFREHSTTGDGILSALKFIEALKFFQKPFKELIAEIKLYPQLLKNVMVKEKVPFESSAVIQSKLKEINEFFSDKGRVLLRYSGTEPKARVMVEGENEQHVHDKCAELAELIKKELG